MHRPSAPSSQASRFARSGAPLEGLRVVELAGEVATRYCGRLYASLGARVTRLADGADDAIGHGGAAGAAFGAWLDQDKRAVGRPQDALAALDGAEADDTLVICGQTPEAIAGAEALLEGRGEGAVRLNIRWFDAKGPYSAWRGNDAIIQALTGCAYSFGPREGPPTLAQGHGPQIIAGVTAFIASLAAIIGRRRGLAIDGAEVNVFEAAMCLSETGAITHPAAGTHATRLGINRFSPTYPCSIYRASDGWVGVTALTPAQWEALCGLIGRPELARDPGFATTYERLMRADEVDRVLEPAFAERSVAQWLEAGDRARIPMAPTLTPAELPAAPHWRSRESFSPISQGSGAPLGPSLPFAVAHRPGSATPLPPAGPGGPLAGLKVVDFSMGWAGPLATRHLGDLGAQVIKIESQAHPDWWRGWERGEGADPNLAETRLNFIAVNRNKHGICLDLTSAEGLSRAKELIAGGDVVVENFAPGVLERLGLGAEVQGDLRAAVISISMGAFGARGPWRGLRAYGSTVEHACGLPFVNGQADWPPCLQHVAYGDPIAGLYAAAAALGALYGRPKEGGGFIDLAQVEGLFQIGADAILAAQTNGEGPARMGSRRQSAAPSCVVAAAGEDQWLAVVVTDEAAWTGLCDVIGQPGWASEARLASARGRNAQAPMIEAAIAAWAGTLSRDEAADRLQRAGVGAAPVLRGDELGANPQLMASGYWRTMERRYVGRHVQAAAPWRLDGRRPELRLPAPTLGEHTAMILEALSTAREHAKGGRGIAHGLLS